MKKATSSVVSLLLMSSLSYAQNMSVAPPANMSVAPPANMSVAPPANMSVAPPASSAAPAAAGGSRAHGGGGGRLRGYVNQGASRFVDSGNTQITDAIITEAALNEMDVVTGILSTAMEGSAVDNVCEQGWESFLPVIPSHTVQLTSRNGDQCKPEKFINFVCSENFHRFNQNAAIQSDAGDTVKATVALTCEIGEHYTQYFRIGNGCSTPDHQRYMRGRCSYLRTKFDDLGNCKEQAGCEAAMQEAHYMTQVLARYTDPQEARCMAGNPEEVLNAMRVRAFSPSATNPVVTQSMQGARRVQQIAEEMKAVVSETLSQNMSGPAFDSISRAIESSEVVALSEESRSTVCLGNPRNLITTRTGSGALRIFVCPGALTSLSNRSGRDTSAFMDMAFRGQLASAFGHLMDGCNLELMTADFGNENRRSLATVGDNLRACLMYNGRTRGAPSPYDVFGENSEEMNSSDGRELLLKGTEGVTRRSHCGVDRPLHPERDALPTNNLEAQYWGNRFTAATIARLDAQDRDQDSARSTRYRAAMSPTELEDWNRFCTSEYDSSSERQVCSRMADRVFQRTFRVREAFSPYCSHAGNESVARMMRMIGSDDQIRGILGCRARGRAAVPTVSAIDAGSLIAANDAEAPPVARPRGRGRVPPDPYAGFCAPTMASVEGLAENGLTPAQVFGAIPPSELENAADPETPGSVASLVNTFRGSPPVINNPEAGGSTVNLASFPAGEFTLRVNREDITGTELNNTCTESLYKLVLLRQPENGEAVSYATEVYCNGRVVSFVAHSAQGIGFSLQGNEALSRDLANILHTVDANGHELTVPALAEETPTEAAPASTASSEVVQEESPAAPSSSTEAAPAATAPAPAPAAATSRAAPTTLDSALSNLRTLNLSSADGETVNLPLPPNVAARDYTVTEESARGCRVRHLRAPGVTGTLADVYYCNREHPETPSEISYSVDRNTGIHRSIAGENANGLKIVEFMNAINSANGQ